MPSADEFRSKHPSFTLLVNGQPGSGKTTLAMSFPKVYVIGCDPAGLDILHQKENIKLLDNLIWYEYLHNESEPELKRLFQSEKVTGEDRWSLFGCLAHAKELAKAGEINTILLDNVNYLVDMKWQHICEYEEVRSNHSGNLDQQAMYRNLGLWCNRFFASELMTMATRQGLNVVMTSHLRRESPEAIEGTNAQGQQVRAAKIDKSSDLAPQIEGGFRNKIEGLVGASIYLEHKELKRKGTDERVLQYLAICKKTNALDTTVLAKNRYGLPNVVNVTNKSFYEILMSNMAQKEGIK